MISAKIPFIRLSVLYLGLFSERHDSRHFLFRDFDFSSSVGVLLDASDAKVGESGRILLDLFARRNGVLFIAASSFKKII
jgi:hypothetical protein